MQKDFASQVLLGTKNALACGAGVSFAEDTGLSDAGIECVKRMEQLHMLIDLAHTSPKTFDDILAATSCPVIVSHGNCKALCDAPRNYSDAQLRAVSERGGVIGISVYPPFMNAAPSNWDVDMLARHIIHAIDIAGEDHVGFGFDFVDYLDDYGTDPSISCALLGMESESKAQTLVDCLRGKGVSEAALEKICHGNFEYVLNWL